MRNTLLYILITFTLCTINALDLRAATPYTAKDSIKVDSLAINNDDLKKSKSGLDQEIKYSAEDSLDVDNETKIVHLYGKAVVEYGSIKLEADYIWINMEKNELHAYGRKDSTGYCYDKAQFTDKDQKFNSSEISYNFKTQKGRVVEVITQEGESYIHGSVIKRLPDNVIYVGQAKYTTCNAEHPHFHFSTSKIKMIQNDKIVTGAVNLVVNDVPTPLILPFGIFPNNPKRASGIIIPAYGENKSQGFYLTGLGFHWAINDKINYTIYSDIFTQGSWAIKNNINYKTRYKYSGSLNFNYTNTTTGDRDLYNFRKTRDFRFSWSHQQDASARPGSSFSANVNFGTSSAFQNSLVANNDINNVTNNTYTSSINYSQKLSKRLTLNTTASHSQNMISRDVNISAPTFTLRMSPYTVKKGIFKNINLQWGADLANTIAAKDTNLFESLDSITMKNGLRNTGSISYSGSFKPFKFLNISLPSLSATNYTYLDYIVKNYQNGKLEVSKVNQMTNATSLQIGGFGFNNQLFLTYRPISALKNKTRIKYFKHTIKSGINLTQNLKVVEDIINGDRVTKYYTDGNNNRIAYNAMERNLYSGPSSTNISQLSFNIDNSVDMKIKRKVNGRDTTEKIRLIKSFNISSGYNMAASKFNWSNFNVQFTTDMFNNLLNINFNSTLSPYAINSEGVMLNTWNHNEGGDWARVTAAGGTATLRLASKKANMKSVFIKIPTDISIQYDLQYSKPGLTNNVVQALRINGNITLTPKWSFTYVTGYDIQSQKMTVTSFTINRDLHCWNLSFTYVPFGQYQSWSFLLHPKANLLKEMKLQRNKNWQNKI
ncbi:MAG: putative LPS assembly protein LptD [Flavobacteriales bacterium]